VQRRPAEVVGQVHVAARRRAADALWAAAEGGPLALLPLCIEAVDLHSMAPQVRSAPLSLSASQLLPHVLRIIARSLRRPMNREELKGPAPALLSHLLHFVLSSPPTLTESAPNESAAEYTSGSVDSSREHSLEKRRDRDRDRDKELVHACMLLAHVPRPGDHLKNHLMEHLLLHLPLWAPAHLSTQRALLAAVGDAVSLELQALQSVGAVSLLLDGCRRCYWMTWEPSSVRLCTASWNPNLPAAIVTGEAAGGLGAMVKGWAGGAGEAGARGGGEWGREEMQEERMGMMGEVNGMVNAVMGALEKLVCAGVGLDVMGADMRALVSFALQCPQANQVARVLLLLYRLMSQPNSSRASAFMVQFLASGGAEMLLALLLRETQYGETYPGFPLTDVPDAIMVAVVSILGLLADSGFLRLSDPSVLGVVPTTQGLGAVVTERAGKDRSNVGAWAVYGVQKALELAPKRLFTPAVYHAIMTAVLRCKAVDSPSAILPPSTFIAPWEQQLLLALLRALPSAAPHTQLAVLQDLLLLLSVNPANTRLLTHSPEWPEWLLEILLANLEALPSAGTSKSTATQGQLGGRDKEKESSDLASAEGEGTGDSRAVRSSTSVQEDVNELIFSFLGIVFEHCLTVKQGWKVLEATFHCLQWKALIGGSSVGEQLKSRTDPATADATAATTDSPATAAAAATDAASNGFGWVAEFPLIDLSSETLPAAAVTVTVTPPTTAAPASTAALSPSSKTAGTATAVDASSAAAVAATPTAAAAAAGMHFDLLTGSFSPSTLPLQPTVSPPLARLSSSPPGTASLISLDSPQQQQQQQQRQVTHASPSGLGSAIERNQKEGVGAAESGVLAVLGGVGAGMSDALKGVLDDDQSLVTILRVVLVAARETDGGEMGGELIRKGVREGEKVTEKVLSSLLWRILAPLLTTSRLDQRQNCALSVAAILHTEIIHSIDRDRTILRPTFVALLLPPFTALLRKWRPALRCLRLLSDHTGASPFSDPHNPALATDASPTDAALAFLSPVWVAAFASPPAAVCLAATAAATGPAAAHGLGRNWSSSSKSGGGGGGVGGAFFGAGGAAARMGRERKLGHMDRLYGLADGRPGVDGVPGGATSAKRREKGDIQRSGRWSLWDSLEGAWGDVTGLKHPALKLSSLPLSSPVKGSSSSSSSSSGGSDSGVSSSIKEWDEVEMRYSISLGPRVGGLQLYLSSLHDLLELQTLQEAKLHSPIVKARAAGARMWRSVIRQLLKSGRLCGARASHEEFIQSPTVWQLDRMETSLRMRRRVKPCFSTAATATLRASGPHGAIRGGAAAAEDAVADASTDAAAESAAATAAASAGDTGTSAAAVEEAVQRLGGALPAPLGGFMRGGGGKGGEERGAEGEGEKEQEKGKEEEGGKGGGEGGEAAGKEEGGEEGGAGRGAVDERDGATAGAVAEREGLGSAVAEETVKRNEVGDGVVGGGVEGGASGGEKHKPRGPSKDGKQRGKLGGVEWTLVADVDGEEVLADVAAMMVQPLRTVKGRLVVTTTRLWFHVDPSVPFRERGCGGQGEKSEKGEKGEVGGGEKERGQEVAEKEALVSSSNGEKGGKIGRSGGATGGEGAVKGSMGDRVWRLSSVREVLTRRYLLRRSALEIFMIDRANFFFAFEGAEERKRVHRAIERAHPPHFQHLFSASQRPENILEKLQLTKKWVNREITNFEYLMHLNTLAGRSFNDVTQYPVFPWVIQDYTSKELDLTKTATFRDLSKPMGALTQPRLAKIIERYETFDDPVIPKFHHGTHYSSAAI
ncbi:unnamed protein product, partial [Closterium sp. Yama58-4]